MRRRHSRRKPKTAQQLRSHALGRAFGRCGVGFSTGDIIAMEELIRTGRGTHLVRQSNNRGLWKLEYKGGTVFVIYDKLRSAITTFLTKEMADSHLPPAGIG